MPPNTVQPQTPPRQLSNSSVVSHTSDASAVTPRRLTPAASPLKIVVMGTSNVGKSSLVRRYVDQTFASCTRATHFADFREKKLRDGTTAQIWDTAGQDNVVYSMSRQVLRGAHAVLVVASLDDRRSLDQVPDLLQRVRECVQPPASARGAATSARSRSPSAERRSQISDVLDAEMMPVPTFLVLNKIDAFPPSADEDRELYMRRDQWGLEGLIHTSALRGDNVDAAFGKAITAATATVSAARAAASPYASPLQPSVGLQPKRRFGAKLGSAKCPC